MSLGSSSMMKVGTNSYSGLEEAVFKNIEACIQLVRITRTSMGPNGLSKMILNHLEKLVITKNASAIATEIEVNHPAAKMLVMAAQNQALEYGDGTNLVVTLAGELLERAKDLLEQGLVVTDIIAGYERALRHILNKLDSNSLSTLIHRPFGDLHDKKQLALAIKPALASKQSGYEDFLSELVAEACIQVIPENPRLFNPESIRIAKVPGKSIMDSFVVRGFVIPTLPRGAVQRMQNCRIAVYGCAIELDRTETKGTVLLQSAEELLDLSASEEKAMDAKIKEFFDNGINVIVSQMSFHDLALHFCDKYNILAVKIGSKFEVRRFAKSVGAALNMTFRVPEKEKIGTCSEMTIEEIGDKQVIVARDDGSTNITNDSGTAEDAGVNCRDITTIVLRAATQSVLNDVSIAIGNAVNVVKATCSDDRFLPGAGAAEMALATNLHDLASKEPGLQQYSIHAYAEALEVVPRLLAETAGLPADEVMTEMQSKHVQGVDYTGVNIDGADENGEWTLNTSAAQIYDNLAVKAWAIRMATDTACNVLRVDVIVMRKQAGGPKPQVPGQTEWN
ncbi:TCP-1 chaperonin subunit theta [Giardia lamblia P15]|uniref:CCT-theta n=1 Tax=Giardia intestinalis (strain P15) TaxID=658858 RepID=E1EXS9_GIAIA|nr:TCP-1 chaperonin subunit theta [Giardia lamblia P15]